MKISSAPGSAGLTTLPGTSATSDLEALKSKGFATELRQAADALNTQSTTAGKSVGQNQEEAKKLRKVCQDMEAVFLNLLMTQMRASIPKDPLLGDSNGKNIMQSMLDTEMTKDMAKAGGMGLADMLYRQLSPTLNATKGRNTQ